MSLRLLILLPAIAPPVLAQDQPRPVVNIEAAPVTGVGPEAGVCRRDPSDVIRVGNAWYVWYSRVTKGAPLYPSGYHATVWCAMSRDEGKSWTELGESLPRGEAGAWDCTAVFTPNILGWEGRYYLYYTGVGPGFTNKGCSDPGRTAIGVAVADRPEGPWTRHGPPVLETTRDPARFDSYRVDDACLLVHDGKVRMYYKGRQWQNTPANTRMGAAEADAPTGPFRRLREGQPIQDGGHEVLIWRGAGGVYSMVSPHGRRGNTLRLAPDGLQFDDRVLGGFSPRSARAPGLFRPELTGRDPDASGRHWGIHMGTYGGDPYLERYAFDVTP